MIEFYLASSMRNTDCYRGKSMLDASFWVLPQTTSEVTYFTREFVEAFTEGGCNGLKGSARTSHFICDVVLISSWNTKYIYALIERLQFHMSTFQQR